MSSNEGEIGMPADGTLPTSGGFSLAGFCTTGSGFGANFCSGSALFSAGGFGAGSRTWGEAAAMLCMEANSFRMDEGDLCAGLALAALAAGFGLRTCVRLIALARIALFGLGATFFAGFLGVVFFFAILAFAMDTQNQARIKKKSGIADAIARLAKEIKNRKIAPGRFEPRPFYNRRPRAGEKGQGCPKNRR
jgi:hypothetical protein